MPSKRWAVRVFLIPHRDDWPPPQPGIQWAPPKGEPSAGFTVTARTPDKALAAVKQKYVEEGLVLQSINLGPDGIVVCAVKPKKAA